MVVHPYKPARERLSPERRSEIARHAALVRGARVRLAMCSCGHAESEHWSIGARECRTCDVMELPYPCIGFAAD